MEICGPAEIRTATQADVDQLLKLWRLLYEDDLGAVADWQDNASKWARSAIDDPNSAHIGVAALDGVLIACCVATLNVGVPNPQALRGHSVQVANVYTVESHRRHGHGGALIDDAVEWAMSVGADRLDLGASASGLGLYERHGFVRVMAPRMKRQL